MIRIRSALTDRRHTLAAASVIVTLGLAVALTHGTPGSHHMGGMGGGDGAHATQSTLVTMCFAIIELGAIGVGAAALRHLARRRLTIPADHASPVRPGIVFEATLPPPKVRAGPSLLQVYRL